MARKRRSSVDATVRSAAGLVTPIYDLNRRVQERGLPRLAWVLVAIVGTAGTAVAVLLFFATRGWIAPAVLFGVTWLAVLMIAGMGDMISSQQSK